MEQGTCWEMGATAEKRRSFGHWFTWFTWFTLPSSTDQHMVTSYMLGCGFVGA